MRGDQGRGAAGKRSADEALVSDIGVDAGKARFRVEPHEIAVSLLVRLLEHLESADAIAETEVHARQKKCRDVALTCDVRQQLMRDLEAHGIPAVINQVRQHVSIARQYGLPVIAYEGGQSLGTSGGGSLQGDATLEALFDAVNRDPGFGPLYSRYLQSWSDAGGGLFMHYTNCFGYGRFGRFGSLEHISGATRRRSSTRCSGGSRGGERSCGTRLDDHPRAGGSPATVIR